MKTFNQYIYNKVALAFTFVMCIMMMPSCSDMLETESELVEYEKDNKLNQPVDSFYSVMGIINKMQIIADRTVLLGELRGDLVVTTESATSDLKRLAAFDFSQSNVYNQVSDYYAVINNCNYFLAHVDTTLQRRGRLLFTNEYAAVKGFRAWTYLELAKAYGNVPLVTKPLMTEKAAEEALKQPYSTLEEVCNFFIDDLTPYVDVDMPDYKSVGGFNSSLFFIPMKALMGDLCLWAGRYQDAARWYNSYLNDYKEPILMGYSNRVRWSEGLNYVSPSGSYSVTNSSEQLCIIPMETGIFYGVISDLSNVFQSTRENNYFYQVEPTQQLRQLSASQVNCIEYSNGATIDTAYAPTSGLSSDLMYGDLRLYRVFRQYSSGSQDPYSEYSSMLQTLSGKHSYDRAIIYRSPMVYLRYAEALNRAGYPQSAFTILKYGICDENTQKYVDAEERAAAGSLIKFDENVFMRDRVIGIHSRGSGDSQCNKYYNLPLPDDSLATRQDTIDYQIPLVEDLIVNEMALEGMFEGYRYYDLMRVAMHRNDPAYLADPVSRRGKSSTTPDETVRALLMDRSNWFLPLP